MDLSLLLISMTVSIFCIVFVQKIYLHRNVVDKINPRSSHTSLATRTGGMSLFLTLFIISIYYYLIGNVIYDFSLIVPLIILLAVGSYDDIYNVNFKLKFIFQIVAAKIIIDNGLIIDNLHGIIGIYEIGRVTAQLLTMFIIVAIINAINFIDGIDGLAISTIIYFIICFEFFIKTQSPFINLSQVIVFGSIPLYYFNFKRNNKIFLGDSGSLFLGGLVSIYVVYILNNEYVIKNAYDLNKIVYVISILTYPILDITRVFFIRVYNGKSPFIADKNHIHHHIIKKVGSHSKAVALIFTANIVLLVLLQIIF
jgi:UDP-GlcNAc:undecaprenyl-phosphate/decaprenyl-phosphate GlcNAc-1-phosphate transferase